MVNRRKRFPFEISGWADQDGLTGMEAVYEGEWEEEEEEEERVPVSRYHPNAFPCQRRKERNPRREQSCRCRKNEWNMDLPDQETQYFLNMYPEKMSRVQKKVEEECDKMDYEGSMMYDEFPDRVLLKRISRNIYEVLLEDRIVSEGEFMDSEEKGVRDDEEELRETGLFSPNVGRITKLNAQTSNKPREYSHNKDSWLKEAIDVLLMEEIQRRRRNR